MHTLAEPRNQISAKMQDYHNPRKLVPTKIDEPTVTYQKHFGRCGY